MWHQVGLLIICVFSLFANVGQATSIENEPGPVYVQVVRQWLEISKFAENATKRTMAKLTAEMQNDPRLKNTITPDFLSELEKFFYAIYSSPEMIKPIAMIYIKYFTLDELLDLINFYKTPTGKKWIDVNSEIANKSQHIGEDVLKQHQREYINIIKKHIHSQG